MTIPHASIQRKERERMINSSKMCSVLHHARNTIFYTLVAAFILHLAAKLLIELIRNY